MRKQKFCRKNSAAKICHPELRGCCWFTFCLIFFSNKRHSHTLLHIGFFLAEKRRHRFWNNPLWYCLFALLRTVPPICNSFPPLQPLLLAFLLFPCPCIRRPAWSVRVSPIFMPVLQLQRKRIQQGNGSVRSQLAVKEDKEGSLTPSKGWDFIPNTYG